ncbi:MAG: hypothetical protein RIS35_973 [Pseudomonadota bacterium]
MKMIKALVAVAVIGALMPAVAQVPDALREAARQAVTSNPEVQARWHAFLAAEQDQKEVEAGYRPTIDLVTGVGRVVQSRPNLTPRSESFTRRSASVQLTQMVYDGFYTKNQVARFGHARLVRYYELLDAAERTALEAVRAYGDVLRYRELVRYAQDNYVQHRQVLDQIASRTAAGVGRRADLEQATGRLALAESNLLTEVANLHDVSARYLRVVGRPAPETMAPLGDLLVGNVVPATVQDALRDALNANAGLNAAMENVLADERQVEALRAPFRPRLDLRARASRDRSIDRFFVDGTSGDNVVEFVMTYNLSRGGADEARLRRAAESVNEARDMREKVCRDVRQQLAIAYNDAKRLKEQLAFLDQHQMSTEKAREAFRQQFAIGQRTLLDLLDTENEYFQARRAYTSGVYEQILAVARTLTEMGRLTRTLDVTRESLPTPQELGQQRTGVDPAAICPPEAPAIAPIDKEAIFSAAMRAAGR